MDNSGPSTLTQETMPPSPEQPTGAIEPAPIDTPAPAGFNFGEKKRPAALNLTHARTATSSSSSSESSLKVPRTPRFAEATSVHSPIESNASPFADPVNPQASSDARPGDVGFGYISNSGSDRESLRMPKSPLKSAMRVPGTPARTMNLMSPTFREEEILEKREMETEKEQAKDLVRLLGNILILEDSLTQGHRKSRSASEWPSSPSEASTSAAPSSSSPCSPRHSPSSTPQSPSPSRARCPPGPPEPTPGPRSSSSPWPACLLLSRS